MKLLVFADSHGNTAHMVDATRLERPDTIFHLGDLVRDTHALAQAYPEIPCYSVCGNCDGRSEEPEERVVALEGRKFLLMHGHTRGVKSGEGAAVAEARRMGAQILLFGHTHRPHCEFCNGLWILNPGAVGGVLGGTYGVISLEQGDVVCYTASV